MKIIFLDIDGVLNTDRAVKLQKLFNHDRIIFDAEAMKNLKELIKETNAYIVISSTWRIHYGTDNRLWKELMSNFIENYIDDRIIDITPVLSEKLNTSIRWKEIETWLVDNRDKEIESFVIIDDEWEMGEYTKDRYVKCQAYKGISKDSKDKARKILLTPIKNN
ncbi:hypothetical protein PCCS19_02340 [Paenibacillus sp. CCS19]|uniref:HAD domain-containing protein n=1 Tax=Paenibacillus sp. CCS19 TaxID=3158387 RepID=UPI0025606841|nr:HAD domain-containing protein [Paenibacillus cellulosilyticus]GMK37181.1 hypothetical protein PCCS19_02340 [Paenibacillus cellulosilyticus]